MRTNKQRHKARAKTEEARSVRRADRKEAGRELALLREVARTAKEIRDVVGAMSEAETGAALYKAWDKLDDALRALRALPSNTEEHR